MAVEASAVTVGRETYSSEDEQLGLIKLYVLGDVLDDLALRNKSMEIMVVRSLIWKSQPSVQVIKWAYENTPQSSPLRKKLVSAAILKMSRKAFKSNVANEHPEFVQEVAVLLMEQTKAQTSQALIDKLPEFLEDDPSN